MKRIAGAALAYWAGGLALGFLLGPVRVLWVAPRLGEFAAVAAELPVMLAAGWGWARVVLGRAAVVDARGAWLVGAGAFILLLTSECVLAAVLFGRSPDQWAADLLLPAGLLGLAGQLLWALLPGWAWRRGAPDRAG